MGEGIPRRQFLKLILGTGAYVATKDLANLLPKVSAEPDRRQNGENVNTGEIFPDLSEESVSRIAQQLRFLQIGNPDKYSDQTEKDLSELSRLEKEKYLTENLNHEDINSLAVMDQLNQLYADQGIEFTFELKTGENQEIKPEIPPLHAIVTAVTQIEAMPQAFIKDITADLPESEKLGIVFAESILNRRPNEEDDPKRDRTTLGTISDSQIYILADMSRLTYPKNDFEHVKKIAYVIPEELAHLKMEQAGNKQMREKLNSGFGLDYFVKDKDKIDSNIFEIDIRNFLWGIFYREIPDGEKLNLHERHHYSDEIFRAYEPGPKIQEIVNNLADHPLYDPWKQADDLMYVLTNEKELFEGLMRDVALFGPEIAERITEVVVTVNAFELMTFYMHQTNTFQTYGEMILKSQEIIKEANETNIYDKYTATHANILHLDSDPIWRNLLKSVFEAKDETGAFVGSKMLPHLDDLITHSKKEVIKILLTIG